jgi:intracellular multiplication protein IcmE
MVDEHNPQDENGQFDQFNDQDHHDDSNGHQGTSDDHFMEEDDFLAADRGSPDDLDAPPPKPNLKEIWQQNPSVKIFAVVAFLAVCLISFLVFGSSDKEKDEAQKSVVSQGAEVNQAPGTQELPPAYEKAVREESDARAQEAANTGGSAIPTPIARPSERIEAPVQTEQNDPLSEWRKEAEERRTERQQSEKPVTATNVPLLPTNNAPPQISNNNGLQQQTPQNPPLPTGPTPEQVASIAQQLQQQMQTIMETQVPKESVVVSMNIQPGYDPKKYFGDPAQQNASGTSSSGGAAGNAAAGAAPPPKPLIQAGTIGYGQILTQANSDVPGPVLAEIASGPLVGGRAIGTFSVAQNQLVLQFNRIVKDGVEYQVQVYALDPGTTLPAVVTDVDHHYFSRVIIPAAAEFIEGYADAATQRDTSVVVTNGTVVSNSSNNLDTKQELLNGVNQGAQQASSVLQQDFGNRPVTIKVAAGTRIGLLFVSSVFDPAALQGQGQQGQGQGQFGQNGQNGAAGYLGQAYNAYNAYNTYANGNSNGSNNNYGSSAQQQYYQNQQYQQQQQQQYTGIPSLRNTTLR